MGRGTTNNKGRNYNWYGGNMTRKLGNGMEDNFRRAANVLKNDIVQSFPSTGSTGTRSGGPGGSAPPGSPPAVQTGNLRRSMNWEVNRRGMLDIIARVGTGIGSAVSAGYAVWQEFGTRRSAARPFLRPMLKKDRNKLAKIIGKNVL